MPLLAPKVRIVHVVIGSAEPAFVNLSLFVWEVTTSSVVPVGSSWGLVFWPMAPQKRSAIDRSGGDRATLGRGMARSHAGQHCRSQTARHALDRGVRRSATATSVRPGGRGGSASHEAITSAKAKSSSSGSASTTARNSSLAPTTDLSVSMTDHAETGWRSSAVAEITWSRADDTPACSSVDTVILRGLARSATGMVSRSTPLL